MATLKFRDLSVGSWVLMDGEPAKALRLAVAGRAIFKGLSGQIYTSVGGDIFPLPIVPEILEKNGFESTTKPNVFTLTHGELQLYVSEESDGWYMSFVNFRERLCILQVIRQGYIHQLQHALRLAGVDKEINL